MRPRWRSKWCRRRCRCGKTSNAQISVFEQQLALLEILETSRHARAKEELEQQKLELDYVRTAAARSVRASVKQQQTMRRATTRCCPAVLGIAASTVGASARRPTPRPPPTDRPATAPAAAAKAHAVPALNRFEGVPRAHWSDLGHAHPRGARTSCGRRCSTRFAASTASSMPATCTSFRCSTSCSAIAPVYAARGNGEDGSGGRPVQPEDPRVKYAWLLEFEGVKVGLTHYVPVPDGRRTSRLRSGCSGSFPMSAPTSSCPAIPTSNASPGCTAFCA